MVKSDKMTSATTESLLSAADYFRRPQRFIAVADARAELRGTLAMAQKGSVVLTAHGAPEAVIMPFTTVETLRSALLGVLVEEMAASFARTQASIGDEPLGAATTEEELESLVSQTVRGARRSRQSRLQKDQTGRTSKASAKAGAKAARR